MSEDSIQAVRRRSETHAQARPRAWRGVADARRKIGALGNPIPEYLAEPGKGPSPAWRRLRSAARHSMRRCRVDATARDHEDLLQEALHRLLEGSRRWRRGVDFEYQVARAMDSIATHWRRHAESHPEICEAVLDPPDDGGGDDEEAGALPDPASPEAGVERRLVAAEEVEKIEKRFEDDPEALQVLRCFDLGLTRSEMCDQTRMSEKQLAAAIRRVRRGVER